MVVSAFAEVVSLGSVIPFLGILTVPEKVFRYPVVEGIARSLQVTSADQLVLPMTLAFAIIALVAGGIRMLLLWLITRLAFASGADLSFEAYRRTLYQPYSVHVARNSSEVISGITTKVNAIVFGALLPSLTLASAIVLLVAIMLALIAIDPIVATASGVGFGGTYMIISLISHRRLQENSERIAHEQTKIVKALQEGMGSIRDMLLDGTQGVYCEIYRKADLPTRRAQGDNVFIGGSPRFLIETLGLILIGGLAYTMSLQSGGIAAAVPVLGVLALGAQRLLPSLQQSFSAWSSIVGIQASLADTLALIEQPIPPELEKPEPLPLEFHKEIRFDNVRFRYGDDGPWVLDGLNLTIRKGSRVGFVGTTGGGKSTALDILMGLLTPTKGVLSVDGKRLDGNRLRAWQLAIAHVPQSIYLSDTSLAENIAFGIPPQKIDMERVRESARRAHIADFIEEQKDGYHSGVGERGIRLSGGQRQRIGIARALYKQAEVLVFDEATSALDNATEHSVMDSISDLGKNLTILIIAHRLTTVEGCDNIIALKKGRVVAEGTYNTLLKTSADFREIARSVTNDL